MTATTKQIRAALAARFPAVSDDPDYLERLDREREELARSGPFWLAWCLEQIEARDALLRQEINSREHGWGECRCDWCQEARKVMEA